jgi:ABC-type sulfate transport system permease component
MSAAGVLLAQALATAFVYAVMVVGEAFDALDESCEELAATCRGHTAEASHG